MNETKRSTSASSVDDSESSWSLIAEETVIENSSNEFLHIEPLNIEELNEVNSDLEINEEKHSSVRALEKSESSSTIRNFLENESITDINMEETRVEDIIKEHDYELDKCEYFENLLKKTDNKGRKKRRKEKMHYAGTLSIIGPVLAMAGLSFICMLIPQGTQVPNDITAKLKTSVSDIATNSTANMNLPVYTNSNGSVMSILNAEKLLNEMHKKNDTKIDHIGPATQKEFLKQQNKTADFTDKKPKQEGKKRIKSATQKLFENENVNKNNAKEGEKKATTNISNIVQDLLFLKVTSHLRKKEEEKTKKRKEKISKKKGQQEENHKPEETAIENIEIPHPKLSDKKTDLFKALPNIQPKIAQNPEQKFSRKSVIAEATKRLLEKQNNTNFHIKESSSISSMAKRSDSYISNLIAQKERILKMAERREAIENYKRKNRENFAELKRVRLEFENEMKKCPQSVEVQNSIMRLKKARQNYVEHLHEAQQEFIKQIKQRKQEERIEIEKLLQERRKRQYKDASSGMYEIPVFDNQEIREQLKQLREKENKLCDIVYTSLPKHCLNDVIDCECKAVLNENHMKPLASKSIAKNLTVLENALDDAQKVADAYKDWTKKWRDQVKQEYKSCMSEPNVANALCQNCAGSKTHSNISHSCENLDEKRKQIWKKIKEQQMEYVNKIYEQTYLYWELKRKYLQKRTSMITNTDILMKNMLNNYRCSKSLTDCNNFEEISVDHVALILDDMIKEALLKKMNKTENISKKTSFTKLQERKQSQPSSAKRRNSCTSLQTLGSNSYQTLVTRKADKALLYEWLFGKKASGIKNHDQIMCYLSRYSRLRQLNPIISKQDPSKMKCVKKHFQKQ